MSDDSRLPLDEWLRAAYAETEAGCPPPEAFLEEEMAGLSPDARRTLEAHADRCPACAAERDLARLFDAAPAARDLDFVVSRLEKSSPVRSRPSNVVPFPVRSRAFLQLAAAALLVLGVGLGYRAFQSPQPALPAPQVDGAMRGGEVQAVSPVGEVAEIPAELRWVPKDGAASYRVRITAVDGSVLWEGTVAAPPVRLPAEAAGKLHRAVLYTWTVEALDPSGARLASSEPARFRVKPGPEQP
jgi:hypothetical protein